MFNASLKFIDKSVLYSLNIIRCRGNHVKTCKIDLLQTEFFVPQNNYIDQVFEILVYFRVIFHKCKQCCAMTLLFV